MTDEQRKTVAHEVLSPGNLKSVHIEIPGTDEELTISMPADFDRLLDQAEGDPEQNLPYWAEIWPSGVALAAHILSHSKTMQDTCAIELGCGLGVTAIAAMRSGSTLIATDYAPEALALCEANCIANRVPAPILLRMNWRNPDADFLAQIGDGVPLLLAADVLYEERDIEPLTKLVESTLSVDGELWLAEPGRRPAARFLQRIMALGWTSTHTTYSGPWLDPGDNRKCVTVTVHQISRPV